MSLSRRCVLLVPSLVAAGVVAGCSRGGAGSGGASASSSSSVGASASSSAGASGGASASGGVEGGVSLATSCDGVPLDVVVGPAVRSGSRTVVRVRVSATNNEFFSLMSAFSEQNEAVYSLQGIRLLSLGEGLAYQELDTRTGTWSADPGGVVELFPVFGAVGGGVRSVEVLLPNLGAVTGVPVVDAGAAGFDVGQAVAEAEIDESLAGPFEIGFMSGAADGSSDASEDADSVTVNVSGDVVFAVDSADLTDQADSVLSGVVDRLGLYPSGGELGVTGHTDDVADDTYNQGLSERRAQAVADRLGQLTDLKAWRVSVAGKGESAPRVPNDSDENRQLNRRVEVAAVPKDPGEGTGSKGRGRSGGQVPQAAGAVGHGPEGVEVPDGDKKDVRLRLVLPEVKRVGRFLVGNVELTPTGGDIVPDGERFAASSLGASRWERVNLDYGTMGFTLLRGGTRYLAADFDRNGTVLPLTTSLLQTVKDGVTAHLPVVWPDTGEESVTLDLPGITRKDQPTRGVVARLTDILVTNA